MKLFRSRLEERRMSMETCYSIWKEGSLRKHAIQTRTVSQSLEGEAVAASRLTIDWYIRNRVDLVALVSHLLGSYIRIFVV